MSSAPILTRPAGIIEPLPDPFQAHGAQPPELWDTPVAVGPLTEIMPKGAGHALTERVTIKIEAPERKATQMPRESASGAAQGSLGVLMEGRTMAIDTEQQAVDEPLGGDMLGGAAAEILKEPLVSPVSMCRGVLLFCCLYFIRSIFFVPCESV